MPFYIISVVCFFFIPILFIKNKFILKKIFNFLTKNKTLSLIQYNKSIQQKLNIDINNYKNYYEIEIEIIPAKNKNGKFINIINKNDEIFFHIFFNDNNKKKLKNIK